MTEVIIIIWFVWGVSFIIRDWAREGNWYPMKEIGLYIIFSVISLIYLLATG